MRIDGPGVSEVIIIPHGVQDLLARERDSFVLHEVGEQLELLEGEFHFAAVDGYLMSCLVNPDLATRIFGENGFEMYSSTPRLKPSSSSRSSPRAVSMMIGTFEY